MARVIAVASPKGGVGKTTTVLNTGYSLAKLGARVLLIDGDPQGGLANASNLRERSQDGLLTLLSGQKKPEDVIVWSRDKTLAVMGVGVTEPREVTLLEQQAEAMALSPMIAAVATAFDYVLLDTPAGVGGLVRGLLAASELVLVPITAKPLSLRALPPFLQLIKDLAEGRPSPRLLGVVVTMHDWLSSVDSALCQQLKQQLPKAALFKTVIPHHDLFEQASLKSVPVALLRQAREAAEPYLALAAEIKAHELLPPAEDNTDESPVGLF
jgi:chromosome partitioning protein